MQALLHYLLTDLLTVPARGDSGLRNLGSVALGESAADGGAADAQVISNSLLGPTLTTKATATLRLVFSDPKQQDHGNTDQSRHPRQKACDGHWIQL